MTETDKDTIKASNDDDDEDIIISAHCRIAIFGAQRGRVAKVLSILQDPTNSFLHIPIPGKNNDAETRRRRVVKMEYLPCVATFDSYQNDCGNTIRYLAKIEYHGNNGMNRKGSSVAPFFDKTDDDAKGKDGELCFSGVSAVAIGCGIECEEDVSMIEMFVQNLSGGGALIADDPDDENNNDENKTQKAVVVECIKPNSEYQTVKEENEAFKNLDEQEKMEATKGMTMGPGKMAKFVASLGERVVNSAIDAVYGTRKGDSDADGDAVEDSSEEHVVTPTLSEEGDEAEGSTEETNELSDEKISATSTEPPTPATAAPPIARDPNVVQYACKRCRTILFEESDLENPPHRIACHNFNNSRRYGGSQKGGTHACENVFLAEEMDWMGDISAFEGRLHCPKCSCKVGHWKWAGSQCSCGTWVTPAIQIPLGRVDVMKPFNNSDVCNGTPIVSSSVGFAASAVSPIGG